MNENTAGLSTKWLKRQIKKYGAALKGIVDTLAKKQALISGSDEIQPSEGDTLSLTPSARLRPFVELCRAAGVAYNESTGFFELNGLKDITEVQMRAIYAAGAMTNSDVVSRYAATGIRTHLPAQIRWGVTESAAYTFRKSSVEVVSVTLLVPGSACFKDCARLKSATVYSPCSPNGNGYDAWAGCASLESLTVTTVYARNVFLGDSPLISLASLRGLADKTQAGAAAITITVHPDVYAKITDPEGHPDWAQLLADAAEKNILFTTTTN